MMRFKSIYYILRYKIIDYILNKYYIIVMRPQLTRLTRFVDFSVMLSCLVEKPETYIPYMRMSLPAQRGEVALIS